jgi:hypothetical protein
MSVFRLGIPILNLAFKKARVAKRAQKIFEKIFGENQAAGLSRHSAYKASKDEVIKKYKLKVNLKGQVLNKSEGGPIQKKLAGGLLRVGIKTIYRDPASRKALSTLKDFVLKQYRAKNLQSLSPVGKLDLKIRTAQGLKKYSKLISTKINPDRFKGSRSMTKKAKSIMKTAELAAGQYENKLKQITKAFMHKRANPQIKTHSEGGEVVIGKNVDKDLL